MDKIAVIGISVELPSGTCRTTNLDHESFFQFLLAQEEAFEVIPSDRLNIQAWHGKHAGYIHTAKGAFLKDLDMFDNVEFGVSMKDAQAMAISTRKLIEHSFLALRDSGINYRSQSIGCYASGTATDSVNENIYQQSGSFGGQPAMIANRISQHLDLTGPSIPIDTACSSSGAALHLAAISLLAGDCSAAVVAGAQINSRFSEWFNYSQGSILSPDGRSKPFDASANGFSRAEGVAAIVLKPLDAAIRDGDYIYGTVLASATSTNGAAAAPGAPVAEAQGAALKQAFQRSGRTPEDVDYVECHATGTSKGDPVETNNIGEHFHRADDLFIGSVKGNIGHTEITSFLASFSKVLSMLEHQTIPPNVKLQFPNPAIYWDKYRLRVAQEAVKLSQRSGGPSLISISSTGIGGVNVHVIVEGAQSENTCVLRSEGPCILFLAGGLSPRSATSVAESLPQLIQNRSIDVDALATKLGRQTRQMAWRSFVVTDRTGLSNLPTFPAPSLVPRTSPPIVFIFSGQGPQHARMGRAFFQLFPAFRESVRKSDVIYKDRTGHSIVHDVGLFGNAVSTVSDPWPIAITLPALAIFQIALFDLLSDLNVIPDVLIGHSAGEVPVLYASGAASRELVVELAIARGEAFSQMEKQGGTMAALACSSNDAEALLRTVRNIRSDHSVDVACYNSKSAVAIAGHEIMIDLVLQLAKDRGIDGQKIRTRVPVHSSMMEHCREDYVRLTEEVFKRHGLNQLNPLVTTYSTLTGSQMKAAYDSRYFWNTTRYPVRFTQAIDEVSAEFPNAYFVEISPHPVLSAYIRNGIPNWDRVAAASRRPTKAGVDMEHRSLLETVGELTVAGYNGVHFSSLNGQIDPASVHRATLEKYPFQKKSFPIYSEGVQHKLQISPHLGPLNHSFLHVNQATHPKLAEHVVLGEPIMPAAGFLEMAFENRATAMINIKFRTILPLSSSTPLHVDVALNGPYWSVKSGDSNKKEEVYADGYLSFEKPVSHELVDIDAIRARCNQSVDGPSLYASLVATFQYGPHFQRVKQVFFNKNEALMELSGHDLNLASDGKYIIHPAILDSSFHFLTAPAFTGNFDPNEYYLPSSVSRVIFCGLPCEGYFPDTFYAHARLRRWVPSPGGLSYDITLMDRTGKVLLLLEEFELSCRLKYPREEVERRFEQIYQPATFDIPGPTFLEDDRSIISLDGTDAQTACIISRCINQLKLQLRLIQSHDRYRVVNVLVICQDSALDTVIPILDSSLSDSRTVYVTYAIQGTQIPPGLNLGKCRIIFIDSTAGWKNQGLYESSFEFVLLLDAQPLSPSEAEGLKAIHRVLVPGGVFYAAYGDSESAVTLKELSEAGETPFFSPPELRTEYAGSLIACRTIDTLPNVSVLEVPDTFLFWYRIGEEDRLQISLTALDAVQSLNIWIAAEAGRDSHAATGLVRSLRHEYTAWSLHSISFPEFYAQDQRWKDRFSKLPLSVYAEDEVIISTAGECLVPRIRQIPALDRSQLAPPNSQNALCMRVISSSLQTGSVTSFVGVVPESPHGMKQFTLGLSGPPRNGEIFIDRSSIYFHHGEENWDQLASDLGGMIVAPLALGISTFENRLGQCGKLHVLLTHSDSHIGTVVLKLFEKRGIKVTTVDSNIDIIGLSRLQVDSFDVIVSGHSSKDFLEVAKLFTRNTTGRVYSWSQGESSLPTLVENDPLAVHRALRCSLMAEYRDFVPVPPSFSVALQSNTPKQLFRWDKSYVLMGGIGSMGAHIALWMYQNGARNITLASRTMNALQAPTNILSYRILQYLQSCDDLTISLEFIDATKHSQVKGLVERLPAPLGGCFLLMTSKADAIFTNLKPADFTRLYDVTLGAFDALSSATCVSELDFVVAFTSSTALFGNGGQTNYSASKTALEGALKPYKNAFSFVCPAVSGTTLVTSATNQALTLQWQVSISDILMWLEDGMRLHLTGTRHFDTYIPDFDWAAVAGAFSNGSLRLIAPLLPNETLKSTTYDAEKKAELLMSLICRHLGIPAKELSKDVPLTTYGLDSLSSSRLSLSLSKEFGLKTTQIQLLANTSTKDLLLRLESVSDEAASLQENMDSLRRTAQTLENVLSRYSLDKPSSSSPSLDTSDYCAAKTVILTGATGSLGCHLLSQLIEAADVNVIYALNRASSTMSLQDKQAAALEKEGLPSALSMSSKVIYIPCDYDQPMLGLTDSTISLLSSTATHVVHNAWVSDFVAGLPAYEKLIERTRDLITMALNAGPTRNISFCFISTTGVCRLSDDNREAPIPLEALLKVPAALVHCVELGYLQSKWMVEQLLEQAVSYGLKASVLRLGQLTGSVRSNGTWTSTQWFPAMVKSANLVNCLPSGEDDVAWLPLDCAASAVLDLYASAAGTYHVVHPRPVSWNVIMSAAASSMNVPLVPYEAWYRSLKEKMDIASGPDSGHVSMKFIGHFGAGISPGIMEYSESMGLLAKVTCLKAKKISATLSNEEFPMLGALDVSKWIGYWQSIEFM